MSKKIVLMSFLILIMSTILIGCSANLPEGIENKGFYKDLGKSNTLLVKSFSDKTYYKDEINDIFNKMNKDDYKKSLNEYELLILETLNYNLEDIETELTTGNRTLSSLTHDNIEWILNLENK